MGVDQRRSDLAGSLPVPDRDIDLNVADLERMYMPRHAALTVSKEHSLLASAQFDELFGRDDVASGGATSPASCRATIRYKP